MYEFYIRIYSIYVDIEMGYLNKNFYQIGDLSLIYEEPK